MSRETGPCRVSDRYAGDNTLISARGVASDIRDLKTTQLCLVLFNARTIRLSSSRTLIMQAPLNVAAFKVFCPLAFGGLVIPRGAGILFALLEIP